MGSWLVLLLALVFMAGCGSTLHLQPNQLLLKSEPTFNRGKQIRLDSLFRKPIDNFKTIGITTIDPSLLYSSVKTHPNRRMIWPKTYLHLYNLGRTLQKYEYPPETAWEFFFPESGLFDTIANFLVNTAGEAPVIVDTAQLRSDAENLHNVYFAQGFWDAKIYPSIDTFHKGIHKGKANVVFKIDEGKAAIIDKVRFDVSSDSLRKVLFKTLGDSYLRTGDTYKEDNLSAERNRITDVMRSNGFYTFNPRQISYDIDTKPAKPFNTPPNNLAIQEHFPIWITVKIAETPPAYHVGRVTMMIEPARYDPELDLYMQIITAEMMTDSLRKAWNLSERMYSDSAKVAFMAYERVLENLNLNFLEQEITLHPGDLYSLKVERETQRRLQSLGIFKYVLIKHLLDEENGVIDFTIQTVLLPRYQIKAGMEGFFENDRVLKNNLPGVGGQLAYLNKMLFKGAEKLDLSAQASVSFFTKDDSLRVFWEGSATASLVIPRIVVPFIGRQGLRAANPSSSLSFTFTRQQSRDYTRNAASLDWKYNWFDPKYGTLASHSLSPMIITLIQSDLSQVFRDRINAVENDALRTLLIQDYQPRFSSLSRYKFTWADYMTTRRKPTVFVQPIAEIGGNLPFLIDRFVRIDSSYKDYSLNDIYYGQFFKLSVEIKNYFPLNKHSELVVRNFVGVAKPWNYTPFVPFESRFYSGGTNSMRGWQSNTLGPGTYLPTSDDGAGTTVGFLVAPGGETVFETNIELRADVYKMIELAIFTDIGNVWFLPGSKVDYEGAKLSRESYLQLGVDAGVGVRLDFSFFVFRVDLARKVYSPAIQDFVVKSSLGDLGGNLFQVNFGIGYPF